MQSTASDNLFQLGMSGVEVAGVMNPATVIVYQEVVHVLRSPTFIYDASGGVLLGSNSVVQSVLILGSSGSINSGGYAVCQFELRATTSGGVNAGLNAAIVNVLGLRYIMTVGPSIVMENSSVLPGQTAKLSSRYIAVPNTGTQVKMGGTAFVSGANHLAFEGAENGTFQFHNGSINIGQTITAFTVWLTVVPSGGTVLSGTCNASVTRTYNIGFQIGQSLNISGLTNPIVIQVPQNMTGGTTISGGAIYRWLQIKTMDGGVQVGTQVPVTIPFITAICPMSGGPQISGTSGIDTSFDYVPVLRWIYVRGESGGSAGFIPIVDGGATNIGGTSAATILFSVIAQGGVSITQEAVVQIFIAIPTGEDGGISISGLALLGGLGMVAAFGISGVLLSGFCINYLTECYTPSKGGLLTGGGATYQTCYNWLASYPRNRIFVGGNAYAGEQHYYFEMSGGVNPASTNKFIVRFCEIKQQSYSMIDMYPYDMNRFPRKSAKVAAITAYPYTSRTNIQCTNRLPFGN